MPGYRLSAMLVSGVRGTQSNIIMTNGPICRESLSYTHRAGEYTFSCPLWYTTARNRLFTVRDAYKKAHENTSGQGEGRQYGRTGGSRGSLAPRPRQPRPLAAHRHALPCGGHPVSRLVRGRGATPVGSRRRHADCSARLPAGDPEDRGDKYGEYSTPAPCGPGVPG